ncbi:MAG TPA: hypothetical protein VHF46_03475 [Rubrobacteraceae bacterium]|nr:hypothetical protein [Rubrobacteraceae bacterium]
MLDLKDKLNIIREKLEGRVLVEGGAMGTHLAERGIDNNHHGNFTYAEVEKFEQKVEVGAHAFQTQPIFESESLEKALEKIEGMDLKIPLELMPPASMPHLSGDIVEPII